MPSSAITWDSTVVHVHMGKSSGRDRASQVISRRVDSLRGVLEPFWVVVILSCVVHLSVARVG